MSKERVLTFELSEASMKVSYCFQYLTFYAWQSKTVSQWKTKCQKMVKFLKLRGLELSYNDKVWTAVVELSMDPDDRYELMIDSRKPFDRNSVSLGLKNNVKIDIDPFNVKMLFESEVQQQREDLENGKS
jgi:hypothetical protein